MEKNDVPASDKVPQEVYRIDQDDNPTSQSKPRLMTSTPRARDLTPDFLGERYVDIEPLATGGMGAVFRAHDTTLDRQVAIKVMLPSSQNGDEQAIRFQREARAVSRLKHDGIVDLLDFGISEDQRLYMIMEFVQGITLRELFDQQGRLSLEKTIGIFSQICDAMKHAHSNGVIHRDLKPSNILIIDLEDEEPDIKILDFGIAKLEEAASETVTRTGVAIGSPSYMSPEQAIGAKVGIETDIYSLGCIIYESFMLEPPFTSDSILSTLSKHAEEAPPQLSEEVAPASVNRIIQKCLEKDPLDRYSTMDQLKEDMNGIELEQESSSGPASIQEQVEDSSTEKPRKFSRVKLEHLLLVAALLLIGGAIAFLSMPKLGNPNTNKDYNPYVEGAVPGELEKKIPMAKPASIDMLDRGIDVRTDKDLEQYRGRKVEELSFQFGSISGRGLENLIGSGIKRLDLNSSEGLNDAAIKTLVKLKSLEELDLSNTDITDEGLAQLASLSGLKDLQLEDCRKITGKGIKEIVTRCKNLNKLKLGFNKNVSPNIVSFIASHKTITSLTLNGLGLTDKDLTKLSDSHVIHMNLSHNPEVTIAGLRNLVEGNKYLKHLTINGTPDISREELIAFQNSSGLNSFKSDARKGSQKHMRNFVSGVLTPSSERESSGASGKRGLEKFRVSKHSGGACWTAITNIHDPDVAILVNHTRRNLYFKGTALTGETLGMLAPADKITHINMQATSLTNAGMKEIAKFKNVNFLDIEETKITDKGLAHVPALKNLGTLYLSKCPNITWKGLIPILENNKKLRVLRINASGVNRRIIPFLIKKDRFRELDMRLLHLYDSDVKELSTIKTKKLRLSRNSKLTPRCLDYLAGNKLLRKVELDDCPLISKTDVEQFRKRRPEVRFKIEIDTKHDDRQKQFLLKQFAQSGALDTGK